MADKSAVSIAGLLIGDALRGLRRLRYRRDAFLREGGTDAVLRFLGLRRQQQ